MSNSKLLVKGGQRLQGTVVISGSKNAALPLMTASLLTDRPVILNNVPDISDVVDMTNLLKSCGVAVQKMGNNSFRLEANAVSTQSPSDRTISGRLRASIGILGPLLVRLGQVVVYKAGGDDITKGKRGVDFHVEAFRKMGAVVEDNDEYTSARIATRSGRLRGANICLSKVSVGATQNIMVAACAADGNTIIQNASIEPETMDLVKLLQNMGAKIEVNKPDREIKIEGKPVAEFSSPHRSTGYFSRPAPVSPAIEHTVIPDRIEAATYAVAAIITQGKIELKMNTEDHVILSLLEAEFWRILAAGAVVTRTRNGIEVKSRAGEINPVSVRTNAYPGFPTDMHPQWAALMCFSNGCCWIEENVFDGRFKYVNELQKMGAAIQHDNRKTVHINLDINGNAAMRNSVDWIDVEATDIRAGAALVLAALARKGVTAISGVAHLNRGYEQFLAKFTSCGARMEMSG